MSALVVTVAIASQQGRDLAGSKREVMIRATGGGLELARISKNRIITLHYMGYRLHSILSLTVLLHGSFSLRIHYVCLNNISLT